MNDAKIFNTDVSRFNFLFKKIAMPANCMREWIQVPEFADAINTLLNTGDTIDNQKVFEICNEIIDEKTRNRIANKGFHFQTLRRGMNHVKKTLAEEL